VTTLAGREPTLPKPAVFYAPAVVLGTWAPAPKHPNLARLAADARKVTRALRTVSELHFDVVRFHPPGHRQPDAPERMRVLLDAIRSSLIALEGAGAKVFMRDVARWAPALAQDYIRYHDSAVEKMRGFRSLLTFLLGEQDAHDVDSVELIPTPPPPSGVAHESVALNLF